MVWGFFILFIFFKHIFTHRIQRKLYYLWDSFICGSFIVFLTRWRFIQSSFGTSFEGSASEENFVCIPLALSWTPHSPAFPFSASPALPTTGPEGKSEGPSTCPLWCVALPLVLILICHYIAFTICLLVPSYLASLSRRIDSEFSEKYF